MSKHRIDTSTPCQRCGAPTHDNATACTTCIGKLRRLLEQMDGVVTELNLTLTRQARVVATTAPPIGPFITTRIEDPEPAAPLTARVTALPMHLGASHVATHLREVLERVVRHLAPTTTTGPLTDWRPAALATWIATHLDTVRTDPQAGQIIDAITNAVDDVRDLIDRPDDAEYLGPCGEVMDFAEQVARIAGLGCPGDLYATPGAKEVRCPVCGSTYAVDERRDSLVERARDKLATLPVIVGLLADDAGGYPAKRVRNMLDGYVHRGRLVRQGWDYEPEVLPAGRRGRATFRIGDATELVEEAKARDAARRAGRGMGGSVA